MRNPLIGTTIQHGKTLISSLLGWTNVTKNVKREGLYTWCI